MSYFKIEKGIEKEGFKEHDNQENFELADEKVWKRDKIVVMGAILYPLDSKNFQTMIAIVGEDGEVKDTKEFYYLIPPPKFKR